MSIYDYLSFIDQWLEKKLWRISPGMGDWIALVALCVTVVGLSSLAEKRNVLGRDYGKYLMDKHRVLGLRVYSWLVIVACVNCLSLVVMLHGKQYKGIASCVFMLLIISAWAVLVYLFNYVLRVQKRVKNEIYREELFGLYVNSNKPCDFEGDRVIGMPTGDRTLKKLSSDVQNYFDRFDTETITAFHEVFGPDSPIYKRDSKTIREWKRRGYGEPHDYFVVGSDKKVVHISWEFFQMFRHSELQDKWLLEILNVFNLEYAEEYPRLRLLNIATIFGQINRVGFAEGLYRYKFLDYMMPHIIMGLSSKEDEKGSNQYNIERYFHVQFGQYIHDTLIYHSTKTFAESAEKALKVLVSVEKFRGVVPVRERILCYKMAGREVEFDSLLERAVSAWKEEIKQFCNIKNIVFDFGNVLVGWDPDNLYGEDGKKYRLLFPRPAVYKKYKREVLSPEYLRELDAKEKMKGVILRRCLKYPLYSWALIMYKRKWLGTLSGEVPKMRDFINQLPAKIRVLGLSNWCKEKFDDARKTHPILRMISEYTISGGLRDDDGKPISPKPNVAMFDYFFKKYNVSPKESLFIDDTYENVVVARSLGMKSIWFLDARSLTNALEPVSPGFKWGDNRAIWLAPDIIEGFDPKGVIIGDFIDNAFSFDDKELSESFSQYEQSDYVKTLVQDDTKCMLLGYAFNPDDNKPMLSLRLQRTQWRYCQFVWHHRYEGQQNADKRQAAWRQQLVSDFLNKGAKESIIPNSLCLHLIIETSDGNVLETRISPEKKNDYPATRAFSIGEQMDLSDFQGSRGFKDNFVANWTVRALQEEFGLNKSQIRKLFDMKTLRVLSLDLEEDIYNFALACTVKMRCTCSEFKRTVAGTSDKGEVSEISDIPFRVIPRILLGYFDKNEFHPSSYLRLALFYLHKGGSNFG